MKSSVPQTSAVPAWSLDSQLESDTALAGDLPLCRVLVANDANYPWLILVPRRHGVREVIDLTLADRTRLWDEVALAAQALKDETHCDKLNIATLGNVVAQLHVHVIARFKTDAAWPKPIWGAVPLQIYTKSNQDRFISKIRSRLQTTAE
jgi:diadenosine tetraphosphate (Ap4A) HIT family hydrolase